jgi:hypothetical protein
MLFGRFGFISVSTMIVGAAIVESILLCLPKKLLATKLIDKRDITAITLLEYFMIY